MVYYTLHLS